MARKSNTLLIVDDDPMILGLFESIFAKRGHRVLTAEGGHEALELVERHRPDLVVSDIRMPRMNGFELLQRIKTGFPQIKRVLMTAGDIDEHMSIIREHDIGNVLSKGGDFHVDEIRRYVESLLDGDIFGLEKNFPQSLIERRAVRSYVDAREACSSIAGYYDADDRVLLEIAIDELVSNAVFHGMLRMSGVSREQWQESYAIEGEQTVTISWAKDEEKIGVSVEDPMGNLKTRDVLRWLDHQIADTASEPDEEHGRGLILVRRLIDRFIVNIDVGKRTECIVIQYHDRSLVGNKKPLLIHEI